MRYVLCVMIGGTMQPGTAHPVTTPADAAVDAALAEGWHRLIAEAATEYRVGEGLGVRRRWVVAEGRGLAASPLAAAYSPLLARVLWARRLRTIGECDAWLAPRRRPFEAWEALPEMPRAVARVAAAVAARQPVAVYGDYDADGLTATAIVVLALQAAGLDVLWRLPHRLHEGYGLHPQAVRELAAGLRQRQPQGRALLIAVDCGTSDGDAIAVADGLGVDVVVLDHHTVAGAGPAALAFVNPKRAGGGLPERELTAAGLTLHLVRGLLATDGLVLPVALRDVLTLDVMGLAALGTLADVAPLTGENRVLVARGLAALRRCCRPGLATLMQAAGVERTRLEAASIVWRLAPRLNAAGRMADPALGLRLLLTEDAAEATTLAAQLDDLNAQRQAVCEHLLAEARPAARATARRIPVLAGPGWSPGLAGLVAGRLAEEIGRPVVVLGTDGTLARGSARSHDGFNIVQALDECRHLLVRYGGHSQAAGVTLACEQIPALEEALDAIAGRTWPQGPPEPVLALDGVARLDELEQPAVAALQGLAPFGRGNEEPRWLVERVHVIDARRVGREGRHLQFHVGDGRRVAAGIAFGQGERLEELRAAGRVDLACHLRLDEWQGRTQVKLFTEDFRPAS